VGIKAMREKPERYGVCELGILGLVDDPHAAFAKLFEDSAVVENNVADHGEPTRACMIPAA